MTFVENKVAIVTGGASGIGYEIAKEFLNKGARGVTIADCDPNGENVVKSLAGELGSSRVIFVEADVTDKEQFEGVFKKTVEVFNNVDILINNAGIYNDATWRREIDVNLMGTINGCLLGLEQYIPKYRSASEGLIVNVASHAGLYPYPMIPIYTATKHGVVGLTRSWGARAHYDRTKVRVVVVCPGSTDTPLFHSIRGRNLGQAYEELLVQFQGPAEQRSEDVARGVLKIVEVGGSGSVWIAERGETYEVEMKVERKN